MTLFDLIAFDADDTLWHNERLYNQTQTGLADLLARYGVSKKSVDEHLLQVESRNIRVFGYGIKSFTLSMIQTAVELTEGRISGQDVLAILDLAKTQLDAPVELLEHVTETVSRLAPRHRLMVITKGELQDQENKMARSGLGEFFRDIEVVSDKTRESSLRSDILPILELGGYAVYVPYQMTWLHEAAEAPASGTPRFYQLEHLSQLPGLLGQLEAQG
jgi:putative hydrolase of the HAD superfamily